MRDCNCRGQLEQDEIVERLSTELLELQISGIACPQLFARSLVFAAARLCTEDGVSFSPDELREICGAESDHLMRILMQGRRNN